MRRANDGRVRSVRTTPITIGSLVLGALAAGCVSTDVGVDEPFAPCAAPSDVADANDAVVSIRANLEPGVLPCSGVAIASNLVVTALGCVVRPAEVGDPEPLAAEDLPRQPRVSIGTVSYEASCVRDGSWSAREDGSFSGRLGKGIAPEDISVSRAGDDRVVIATEIFTSRTVSRCADGIAILRLERDLLVPPVSVRLEDTSALDDSIRLSGHCLAADAARRRDLETHIAALTFEVGTEVAPPRSLWAPATVSSFDLGGAVLSASSGALLGIIVSGLQPACEADDPAAGSVALRLAPFRRMLLDVARARRTVLRAESASLGGGPALAACEDGGL